MISDISEKSGRYLYCVINGEVDGLGLLGIDSEKVYTLSFKGLTVVVHNCDPQPYYSGDNDMVAAWVEAHHKVVEGYWLKYGNVVPFTFNTIIKSDDCPPEELLFKWLEDNCHYILGKLRIIEGCKEYGVQVVMDSKKAAEALADSNSEIVGLRKELARSPAGKAFLIKEKINSRLKKLVEEEADRLFRESYSSIERSVERVQVEKIKKMDRSRIMLLNVSCLADERQCGVLGAVLERINCIPFLEVIFSGPWPAYSFM
ncbi:MAG: GvpL/GvpF family gas vesicle protein [Bacillota bacterium]